MRFGLSLLILAPLSGFVPACIHSPARPPQMVIFSHEKDYSRPLPLDQHALRKVAPENLPALVLGLGESNRLRVAVEHSLRWIDAPSSARYFPYELAEGEHITRAHMRASLHRFREILLANLQDQERARRIEHDFDVYESVGWDGSGTVLFTAYCEYSCRGSLVRSSRFSWPLYRRPDDLEAVAARRGGKYYSRVQIDREGALRGLNLELVYLESPLDCYLVQVQGSAQIHLVEGGILRVGWAGDNGFAYRSIGKLLVEEGRIDPNRYCLEEIRRYFQSHPEDLQRVLASNPRYIFFRETTREGPFGSLGVPVTPRVSIATDKSIFPRGALCFIDTELPEEVPRVGFVFHPFRTFAFDQDTGGAIRSAGRCDLFLGRGTRAQRIAGHTRREGRLYYLFLKPAIFFAEQRISARKGASRAARAGI